MYMHSYPQSQQVRQPGTLEALSQASGELLLLQLSMNGRLLSLNMPWMIQALPEVAHDAEQGIG